MSCSGHSRICRKCRTSFFGFASVSDMASRRMGGAIGCGHNAASSSKPKLGAALTIGYVRSTSSGNFAIRVTMASMPAVDNPAQVADSPKQGLRLRRFLFASAFSVLYLAVLARASTRRTRSIARRCSQALAIVAVFIVGFYRHLPAGLNLRFPRPEPDRHGNCWRRSSRCCTSSITRRTPGSPSPRSSSSR